MGGPEEHTIDTSHGQLFTAISQPTESSKNNPTILFLHGNSSSSTIFTPLFEDPTIKSAYPLLTFDYAGHGRSANAPDPSASYTQAGYAQAAVDVLQHYAIKNVIVLGWSLGGHNAIELIPLLKFARADTGIRLLGIMIVGTPPALGKEQVLAGFHGDVHMGMAATNVLTPDQLREFADVMTKINPAPEWLRETVLRTDGRTREVMFQAFVDGKGADQVKVLQHWKDGLVAIANGGDEPFVNLDYCDEVGKGVASLWEGKCVRFPGLEHAPFYEEPGAFTPTFLKFVEDCCKLPREN